MTRHVAFSLALLAMVLASEHSALAQVSAESAVKGNLSGVVLDATGAVIPGAVITVSGPIGNRKEQSDSLGNFLFPLLVPGTYRARVEAAGYKTTEVTGVEVLTNRTTSIQLSMAPGPVREKIEVSAAAITVDTSSSAVGTNLNETFYSKVPVQRNVYSLFYLSPGVVSGLGSGQANPSISGGSGLENQYVADGVNITDAAFGGLGVYSRVYGSLGTGINLSFIQEVQVKTAGFEPQYGKSTGGVVQIVTKSGSREYHGSLTGFFAPQQMEAARRHPDDFGLVNLTGKTLHQANYDVAAEIGGYVPGLREKFFIFASIDPSLSQEYALAASNSGLFKSGELHFRTLTFNYAFKGTFKISSNHQVESSIFGDPSHTGFGRYFTNLFPRSLNIDNTTGFSRLKFGTRNWVVRYNGVLSPRWLGNASFTWGANHVNETGFADLNEITDFTQSDGLPGQRGVFRPVGLGFFEPTMANTFGLSLDTSKQFKQWGDHTFSIGYRLERSFYSGNTGNSGPLFPIPASNADGAPLTGFGVPAAAIGLLADSRLDLRIVCLTPGEGTCPASAIPAACALCPLMTIPGFATPQRVVLGSSGDFGKTSFDTNGTYHAIYANDAWSPNSHLTLNLGLRWEQQTLRGGITDYTFTDNWSPRLGVIIAPRRDRKTKIFGSFGRYNYALPLDIAERALSILQSYGGVFWAPEFAGTAPDRRVIINSFGTVNPVFDASHLLNKAANGIDQPLSIQIQSLTAENIAPRTKMEYLDEFVVGSEHEFKGGLVASVRYIDRRLRRIIEDVSGVSPEAALAGLPQNFVITNPGPATDLFVNENSVPFVPGFDPAGNLVPASVPAQCQDVNGFFFATTVRDTFGNLVSPGAACFPSVNMPNNVPWIDPTTSSLLPGVLFGGEPRPDGKSDGFPKPSRIYRAVELELNKSFSQNWQLKANWRIAHLYGNYEGAFRNDNLQNDPGISSLFDFTTGKFNLLGDQFRSGVLNTDRRHVVNVFASYLFGRRRLRGLTLGLGTQVASGVPLSRFTAHPVYGNPGEVPIGGRGSLGRTPWTGAMDLHGDYVHKLTERSWLRVGIDLFNVFNRKRQLLFDQYEDVTFGVRNQDFLKPIDRQNGFQRPFYARGMVKLEF